MLESKFKNTERINFERLGWKFITLDPGGGVPTGFPDTLVLSPTGYACYVEWKKSAKDKPKPLQQYWHQQLKDMGHDAFFVYPENVDKWRFRMAKEGGAKWAN